MITVYAGLWYITNDIGEEAKILLFAIMVISNLFFFLIWVVAYIGNAPWAASVVRKFRLEKLYIRRKPVNPYIPETESRENLVPRRKGSFLRHFLCGDYFYLDDTSAL